jgi:hypothetical protein
LNGRQPKKKTRLPSGDQIGTYASLAPATSFAAAPEATSTVQISVLFLDAFRTVAATRRSSGDSRNEP